MKPFKTAYFDTVPSAGEYNRLRAEVVRLSGLTAQYPLQLTNVGVNPQLRLIEPEINAVIPFGSLVFRTVFGND